MLIKKLDAENKKRNSRRNALPYNPERELDNVKNLSHFVT